MIIDSKITEIEWSHVSQVLPHHDDYPPDVLVNGLYRRCTIIESPSKYWEKKGKFVWYNGDIDACWAIKDYPWWCYWPEINHD